MGRLIKVRNELVHVDDIHTVYEDGDGRTGTIVFKDDREALPFYGGVDLIANQLAAIVPAQAGTLLLTCFADGEVSKHDVLAWRVEDGGRVMTPMLADGPVGDARQPQGVLHPSGAVYDMFEGSWLRSFEAWRAGARAYYAEEAAKRRPAAE